MGIPMKKFKNMDEEEKIFDNILNYIDPSISNIIRNISAYYKRNIEEIRLRVNKPLIINMNGMDYFIDDKGKVNNLNSNSFVTSEENIIKTFQIVSNYSVYAVEDELRNGFITIRGGHRIGITGKAIYENNEIKTLKEISSLNIRIAREKIGVSNKIIPFILKNNNTIYHTLIVSPPQCGKTTLLRDLIRNLSNGISEYNFVGLKIGVVDERSEIAGTYRGKPQNDIGIRTDVLDSCQKFDGMMLLLRTMSPQVIATDELGNKKDIDAIHEALKVGVKIIATVHGSDIEDIISKPNLKGLMTEKIFERFIILDNSRGVGTIRKILDGKTYNEIIEKKGV